MSRAPRSRRKIALIVAASIAGLAVVLFVAAIIVVQSGWFRNMVRGKLVSAVEEATGGRAEVGSFSFDWTHLRAVVHDLVLHGSEPPGAAPLFRARLLEVDLKITSPFRSFVDIAYLGVDAPQANVIVSPDGHTNVPAPKVQHSSNTSGLETIVDLAVGQFRLTNGSVNFANRETSLSANGQNLRTQLSYNLLKAGYRGEISMSPLFLQFGKQPPLGVNVTLPVTLEKDRIQFTDAKLTTAESEIVVSGAISHLAAPQTSAHVRAHISPGEAKRAIGLAVPLDIDVAATIDDNSIQVASSRLTLGQSNVEASGTLKGGDRPAGLQFSASLALGQLGRLLRVAALPEDTLKIGGNAKLFGAADRIQLSGLRVEALGAILTGDATLEQMAHFRVNANLSHLDIQQAARSLSPQRLAWDGVVAGPIEAQGDMRAAGEIIARANLAIAPGPRGIPISGRIRASYNGRSGDLALGSSYIALPSTRIDLSGSLGRQIQVRLVTHNPSDLMPAPQTSPVTFQKGGSAILTATVTGNLNAPRIAAHLALTSFSVSNRTFNTLGLDVEASKSGADVSHGVLARGPLQAQFAVAAGLRDWKPEAFEPLTASASIHNADARDLLAVAGQADVPLTGMLNAEAQISGTIGSPRGNASLDIANGTAYQERFDRIQARVNLGDRAIDLTQLEIADGAAKLSANGSYQHPLDDLRRGSIRVHLASTPIDLGQIRVLQQNRPGLAGAVQILADATAQLQPSATGSEFALTSLSGNASARGLAMEGKKLGEITATAQTAGAELTYKVTSDFAGSTIKVDGQSLLTGDHATTATASVANLPVERVLALAGRRDLPVTGVLATNARVSGTLADPHANISLNVTNATAYQEKFDRLQVSLTYSNQLVDLSSLTLAAGANRIEAGGSFAHPPDVWQAGEARFHLAGNGLQLAQLHAIQRINPGLAGTLDVSADGAATLRPNATPLVSSLNAELAAKGLSTGRKPLGDFTATAHTSGNEVAFNLTSNFAKTDLHGNGRMQLAGDYPMSAQITFGNVTYSGLSSLLETTPQAGVDGLAAGQVTVSGPAAKPEALRGELRISTLDVHSIPVPGVKARRNVSLRNAEPIVVALDGSTIRVQSAHVTGPDTDLRLTGTASLEGPRALDLRADGSVHLEVLEGFDPSIFSSGTVALNATVKGTAAEPAINGRLQLQKASFNMLSLPNGLSNANGAIVFDGTEARIENMSGECGGGTLTLTGFVAYGGPEMNFHMQANAHHVRVQYPPGVSTEANAALTAAGNTGRSLISGTVTVLNVALYSHTDVGAILAQSAAPPSAPSGETGLLAGMRFDVRIDTAPDVQFETSLTQNLQAEAHLTLRGNPANPGVLGRVNVSEGEIVFFGSKYIISRGTVAFYNPLKIEPMLNLDLETQAKGVDVTLSVSGPIDQLKLSYHSDPPLSFSDLVGLLAGGKVPTTDPTLAASQPAPPQQSTQQTGASAVLGQAVANPVSGALQRLFGVTQLSIDPQIIGGAGTNTAQATLTLEQQITKQLSFIYIQDLTSSNPQVIRIEWDINPTWSAVAQRDIYGEFGVDFFYKRRFK
jgi:translocation and assembly module TamB